MVSAEFLERLQCVIITASVPVQFVINATVYAITVALDILRLSFQSNSVIRAMQKIFAYGN